MTWTDADKREAIVAAAMIISLAVGFALAVWKTWRER